MYLIKSTGFSNRYVISTHPKREIFRHHNSNFEGYLFYKQDEITNMYYLTNFDYKYITFEKWLECIY